MTRVSAGRLASCGLLGAAIAVTYGPTLAALAHQWMTDDEYSHGVLVVPLAAWFAWQRRRQYQQAPLRPSLWGAVLLLASLLTFVVGSLAAELFLSRVSLIGVLAACVLALFGWRHLRVAAFPLAFLLLMVPLPAIVFNEISAPLQLVASRVGESTLRAMDVAVYRDGNVLQLGVVRLEVAQACSGIRSLMSLLTVAVVLGETLRASRAQRLLLGAATIPIAIVSNGLRVAATGVAAQMFGAAAARGAFHTFTGWLVFIGTVAALFVLQRFCRSPQPRTLALEA
jgi:exosortase